MPLKRRLSETLGVQSQKGFPFRSRKAKRYRHSVLVGVGGNVGDVPRRFCRLLVALGRRRGVQLLETAPILKNPPFGYLEQPDFYNTVMELSTPMQPRGFLRFLLETERRFGRRRLFADGPRTLDLDILFFDGRRIDQRDLQIPHPHWHERQSVVIPLNYLGVVR